MFYTKGVVTRVSPPLKEINLFPLDSQRKEMMTVGNTETRRTTVVLVSTPTGRCRESRFLFPVLTTDSRSLGCSGPLFRYSSTFSPFVQSCLSRWVFGFFLLSRENRERTRVEGRNLSSARVFHSLLGSSPGPSLPFSTPPKFQTPLPARGTECGH